MMNAKENGMYYANDLAAQRAQYTMRKSDEDGERLICNGDALIEAMEDDYYFDEFYDSAE
jgi:hypothetical protein